MEAIVDLFESERPSFKVYRSGASSRADAAGYITAGLPIGVTATDSSQNVLSLLAEYASTGGEVFVDSGAFRLFKEGSAIDYGKVLQVYKHLITSTKHPENLLLVGPDIIGDQRSSIELLLRWRNEVCELIDSGAEVMIPLQRGERSLSECWRIVSRLLRRPFVVGLPSNAAAIPPVEVMEFISTVQPERVHFLGCQENQMLHQAQYLAPTCRITSDASMLRSKIGQGRLLTTEHQNRTSSMLESALRGSGEFMEFDETEMFGYLEQLVPELTGAELNRLAGKVAAGPSKVFEAAQNGSLWDLIDERTYGLGYSVVQRWWTEEARKLISPKAREDSVAHLARSGKI